MGGRRRKLNLPLEGYKWRGNFRISDMINDIPGELENIKVADIISNNKVWDTSIIDHLIPFSCKMAILNTPLPLCETVEDAPSWLGSNSGKFSIKSYYDIITNEEVPLVRKLCSFVGIFRVQVLLR